jgi:hypothetical protein
MEIRAEPAPVIAQTEAAIAAEPAGQAPVEIRVEPAPAIAQTEVAITAEPVAQVPVENPAIIAEAAPAVAQPETVIAAEPIAQAPTNPEIVSIKPSPAIAQAEEEIAAEPTIKSIARAQPLRKPVDIIEPSSQYQIAKTPILAAPMPHGNFSTDLLNWEGIEESMRYAMKNWSAEYPSSPAVNQKLGYDLGVRVSFAAPIDYDRWEAALVYTCFYNTPPATHVKDPTGNLFGNLNFPIISGNSLQTLYAAKGKWHLKMNVLDLELRRPIMIGESLLLQPSMCGKACFIHQRVNVRYSYVNHTDGSCPMDTSDSTNANRIRAVSSVWGVGPELGLEMRFLIPKQFSLFLKGAFAAMYGIFDGHTLYSEYNGFDFESDLSEKKTALFEFGQLQCGLSKWWKIKDDHSMELTVGWETQIWWGQQRMNWWSTTTLPPQGATLSVKGPFFRGSWNF